MSFAGAYALFGSVILLSALLVAGASERLRSVSRRRARLGVVLWLGAHVAIAVAGVGAPTLTNIMLLGTAAGVGCLIGQSLTSNGALVTLGITASIVDIVSFSTGPTRWLLDTESEVASSTLQLLAVSIPVGDATIPVVGVGDLLLLSAFFVGLRSQGLRWRSSFGVLAVGLLVALAVGLSRGGAFGIPFMTVGVLMLLASRRHVRALERCPA